MLALKQRAAMRNRLWLVGGGVEVKQEGGDYRESV